MTRSNDKEMVEMNKKFGDIVQADYKGKWDITTNELFLVFDRLAS